MSRFGRAARRWRAAPFASGSAHAERQLSASRLLNGQVGPQEALRYGRQTSAGPAHLLHYSKDKTPIVVWNATRRCNLHCGHCYADSYDRDYPGELSTDAGLRAAGFTAVATVARPIGGWLSDRLEASTVLTVAFFGVGLDAVALSWQATDPAILPVTLFCLSMAGFLGMGNGAVFKLVPQQFPHSTGAVTGLEDA